MTGITASDASTDAVISSLKKLDDLYNSIHLEMVEKVRDVQRSYEAKLKPLLEQRDAELAQTGTDGSAKGTPALPGFWLEVLRNSDEFGDDIEEYDESILEYLEKVEAGDIDANDSDKGFHISFHFRENPYFKNKQLSKYYHTEQSNDFNDQLEILRIESDKIDWNDKMDVTVEIVEKKKSGGGAKKNKRPTVQILPRSSFFRYFRDLSPENPPSDSEADEDDEDYDDEEPDELERLHMYMEDDYERATSLKDLIIPRAIRWYTGEACPDNFPGDSDDEEDAEDEEELDDEEEDEEEEEEEEEEVVRKPFGNRNSRNIQKPVAGDNKHHVGGRKGVKPSAQQEECKQQ